MQEEHKGLETLKVWKRSLDFSVLIYYQILPSLPTEEKWAMSYQLRRSAQSIPANLAEGYGRYYYQDNVRFCYIARGSLEETFSHLTLAKELGYIRNEHYSHLHTEVVEIRKMINGYIGFLKHSKRGETEPGANLRVRDDLSSLQPGKDINVDDQHPDT